MIELPQVMIRMFENIPPDLLPGHFSEKGMYECP